MNRVTLCFVAADRDRVTLLSRFVLDAAWRLELLCVDEDDPGAVSGSDCLVMVYLARRSLRHRPSRDRRPRAAGTPRPTRRRLGIIA